MKKMLLVFPHPADESLVCGGLIPKYAASGWDIHLVCVTLGEKNKDGSPGVVSDNGTGEEKKQELIRAGKILGLSSIQFLGYKEGTLVRLTPGEIEDKIFREMVRLIPNVIITYEPHGITNDPDRIKCTIAATVAFQRYVSDVAKLPGFSQLPGTEKRKLGRIYQASYEECLALEHEPRLYYACLPESVAEYLKKNERIPEESFDKPVMGTQDKFITTVIDVKRFKGVKVKALSTYKTQEEAERMLAFPGHPLLLQEYFVLRMSGYTEVIMGKNDRVSNRL